MSTSHTPPRPHPVLRLGVAVDPDVALTADQRAQVKTILADVHRVATQAHHESAEVYQGHVQCILVTALDSPTAIAIAEEALAAQCPLHVVQAPNTTPPALVKQAAAVHVIDSVNPAALARTVLRHTDVLIAVGQVPDAIASARAAQIPVVTTAVTDDCVAAIRNTLLPPPVDHKDHKHDHLRQYLNTKPSGGLGGLFASIVRFVAWEKPRWPRLSTLGPSILRARRDWHAFWSKPKPMDPAIAHPINHTLGDAYIWADGLANRYGTLHRDTSTAPAVVALLAAFVAAHIGTDAERVTPVVVAWMVFFLYRRAVSIRYHDRWIDYRSLAEQLRQLAFLWPVGRPLRAVRVRGEGASEAPQLAWVGWYARAFARQAGVFPAEYTPERVSACRDMIVERFIRPQFEYHERSARRFQTVQHRLHLTTLVLFWATLILATVRVFLPHFGSPTLLLVAAAAAILLPATAAAVHGFVGVGDFSNLVRRSTRMAEELRPLTTDLMPTSALTLESVGDAAEAAAEVMSDEVLNWRVFVRLKAPSLS